MAGFMDWLQGVLSDPTSQAGATFAGLLNGNEQSQSQPDNLVAPVAYGSAVPPVPAVLSQALRRAGIQRKENAINSFPVADQYQTTANPDGGTLRQSVILSPNQGAPASPMGPAGQFHVPYFSLDGGATMTPAPMPNNGQASLFNVPYAPDSGAIPGDQAAMTRDATPSPTFGYGDDVQSQPSTDLVGPYAYGSDDASGGQNATIQATQQAIANAPGNTWQEKLANLPSNPLFQVGLALLGSDRRDPLGDVVNSGLSSAQSWRNQQQTDTAQRAIQGFDPSQYSDSKAALQALTKAGVPIATAAQIANVYFPPNEYQSFAPGSTVIDKRTGQVVAQVPQQPEGNALLLDQLQKKRDSFPQGSPQWNVYDTAIRKASGQLDQEQSDRAFQAQQDQRQTNNDLRAQGQQNQQDQNRQKQVTQFSNQMEKTGIPQLQQALDTIDSIMQKYPPGSDLPGYGPIDGLRPTWSLGEDGQRLRQAIQSITNITLKNRSGAAVTDQEFERFRQEMGSSAFLPEARIRQGIDQMRGILNAQKRNAIAGVSDDVLGDYEANGGISLPRGGGNGAAVAPSAPAAPQRPKYDPAAARAELQRRGLIK
jgi:hypothetical protein